ncbi:MAG TPA: EAL domain-containing protein [Acidimicrobiia bacterium]
MDTGTVGTAIPDDRAARAAWCSAAIDGGGDGYTALRAVREGDAIVDWVIVDANALVRERWGWVVGDVVGVRQSQLNGAADNSAFTDLYREALVTGKRQIAELPLALPGGKGGWRRVVVVPIDQETVTVVTRDISRERYFETAVEHERRRLRGLADENARGDLTSDERAAEVRFTSRSAATLFAGAGGVTIANAFLSRLDHVDVGALRVTGVLSLLCALVTFFLPWARYERVISGTIVLGAIAFLAVSDHFDHFSRTESAVAIYPVFFIIVIAWSGLTLRRGAATMAALVSVPALGAILSAGGHGSIGWQCAVVTLPAAAILGEVLSWSYNRANQLARLEANRHLHDSLTGLANRVMLIDHLDQALARIRRTDHMLAVLFVDLDHFKQVNDTLGHSAGDELLVEASARLRAVVRETDTVARLGGDEFVVLCEDIESAREATEVAQRVMDALEAPFMCGENPARVSASVGIVLSVDGNETADAVLKNADTAMYRAKASGGSGYELFDEAMQHWVATRLEVEVALRRAVAQGELRLHYQPVVVADTGQVSSFEALVRWERPGFGLVQPGEFITIAEETGLILEIGAWVLGEACREAAAWAVRWPARRIGIAVNISSRQIIKGNLVEEVTRALAGSGLDPTLLTLELTETTLIDDAMNAQPLLRALRELGVNLALDDFGTGYSSLTYLRTFPINVIKIDQSFVRSVGTDREDTAIVAAVVALARSLNLAVVAEGIETTEQLAALIELRCDHLQGYLFSHPKPVAELAGLVEGPPLLWAPHKPGDQGPWTVDGGHPGRPASRA